MSRQYLMIIGNKGSTNVGESFRRAALAEGWDVAFLDARRAYGDNVLLQRLAWHLFDRRPLRLTSFSRSVEATIKDTSQVTLISTGLTPLTEASLLKLKKDGIKCLHYSTDDPWNPGQRSRWFIRSLGMYDRIFSTRRSNLEDFRRSGCDHVSYLPFAYDAHLWLEERGGEKENVSECDVLFVGGADRDRAHVMRGLIESGLRVALYGDYWGRFGLRPHHRGRADENLLRILTKRVPINLCLCRRANRDGHVMRSFEIPAIGGFMIAEDTREHREIFGDDGECVLYCASEREAVDKARWALHHAAERHRMSLAAHERIVRGANTYGDRLQSMLSVSRLQ